MKTYLEPTIVLINFNTEDVLNGQSSTPFSVTWLDVFDKGVM